MAGKFETNAGTAPMPFFARSQNRTDVASRRLCQPITRHVELGAGRIVEAIEPCLKVDIIDFLVVTTLKVVDPGVD
jgi:hypothetical protein